MKPVPRGPWTSAAQAIGPLQMVCPFAFRQRAKIAGLVLLIILSPVLLTILAFEICAAIHPGLFFIRAILSGLVLSWGCLSLAAIVGGIVFARKRLLLGERGFGLWTPHRTCLILWADLGPVWRDVPMPAAEDEPLTVVLEHANGERLAITSAFAEHHVIALRVLDELERRWPGHRPEARKDGTTDAIKPAERDITEPRDGRTSP
jgi:hypothetical protein